MDTLSTPFPSQGLDPRDLPPVRDCRGIRALTASSSSVCAAPGIYCRPICPRARGGRAQRGVLPGGPVRLPRRLPPLPALPPGGGHPAAPPGRAAPWTVQRALRLIREGALNTATLAALCARLGVGERYLRKLFQRELGVSPNAVAQNQRLLFRRPAVAGNRPARHRYRLCRRFRQRTALQQRVPRQFRQAPRWPCAGGRGAATSGRSINLLLRYRPPYDWDGVLTFPAACCEWCGSSTGRRVSPSLHWPGNSGTLAVRHQSADHAIGLELQLDHLADLMARGTACAARVRP